MNEASKPSGRGVGRENAFCLANVVRNVRPPLLASVDSRRLE